MDRTALVAQLNSIDFQHIFRQHAYCLCFSASHFNHSYASNCVAYLDPNDPFPPQGFNVQLSSRMSDNANGAAPRVLARTLRDVGEGEELTLSCIDLFQPKVSRETSLVELYGFQCECSRCESGSDAGLGGLLVGAGGFVGDCRDSPDRLLSCCAQTEVSYVTTFAVSYSD
jgi:hypothetical protein